LTIHNATDQDRTLIIKKLTAPLRILSDASTAFLAPTIIFPGEDLHWMVPANTRLVLSPEDDTVPGLMEFSMGAPNALGLEPERSIEWAFALEGLNCSLLREAPGSDHGHAAFTSSVLICPSATAVTLLDNPFAEDLAATGDGLDGF
jgi:hypothetical protein